MNEPQYQEQGHERQLLIKEAHSLIAAIASRPGSAKLLRGIMPTLQLYAGYKANRSSERS